MIYCMLCVLAAITVSLVFLFYNSEWIKHGLMDVLPTPVKYDEFLLGCAAGVFFTLGIVFGIASDTKPNSDRNQHGGGAGVNKPGDGPVREPEFAP